jgi:two-component system response regulator AtoC
MSQAILLVDDDDDTRMLMCDGLRRRGFEVETVSSAKACLERIARAPVDMVVTDVQMPGMSGLELCATLKQRFPSVPAIVVTGLKDIKTAAAALASGALALMTKPVTLAALDQVIRCALAPTSLKPS